MKNLKEIRWKQRFENFKRACKNLETAIQKADNLNDLEKEGLIQRFEICFELSWKLLKDYLESEGFILNSPRSTIKQALESNIISDAETWMDMLYSRNLTTHTYDEQTFNQVFEDIVNKYFPLLKNVYEYFSKK